MTTATSNKPIKLRLGSIDSSSAVDMSFMGENFPRSFGLNFEASFLIYSDKTSIPPTEPFELRFVLG